MKNIVLKYGLISSLCVSIWLVLCIMFTTGQMMTWGMLMGFATMFLAFSFIFVGVKQFRDKYNNGSITFGKGFLIGLYITLMASTCYVLVWEVIFNFFIPDFFEKYTEATAEGLKAQGKTVEQINKTVEEMKATGVKYKSNTLYRMALTYTEILPVGLLFSLIAALVWKKKQKTETLSTN